MKTLPLIPFFGLVCATLSPFQPLAAEDPIGSLRHLIQNADFVGRIEIISTRPNDIYTARIKTIFSGRQADSLLSKTQFDFRCPASTPPNLPTNLWRGAPFRPSDELVLMVASENGMFSCTSGAAVFFDWLISSDYLFSQYRDIAALGSEDAARILLRLLVDLIQGSPTAGDPYGARAAIVADWRALHTALKLPNGEITELLQRVFPMLLNSVRFAREGSQFGLVAILAPLLDLGQRQEIMSACLVLYDTFAGIEDLSELPRRDAAIFSSLPAVIDSLMYPNRKTLPERNSDAIILEAREFAAGARTTVAIPESWEAWIAAAKEKSTQTTRNSATSPLGGIEKAVTKATDIVRATVVGEKIGADFHLLTLQVVSTLRQHHKVPQIYKYLRVTAESRPLVNELLKKGGPARYLLLRAVSEEESLAWPFRGQSLSLVDPVRYELADPTLGIVPVDQEGVLGKLFP